MTIHYSMKHFQSREIVFFENADRKSTRLNSSHLVISYAVFCLKKKKNIITIHITSNAAQALSTLTWRYRRKYLPFPESMISNQNVPLMPNIVSHGTLCDVARAV